MSASSPWYKNWLFWIVLLSILGYLSREVKSTESDASTNTKEESAEKPMEDQVLINSMHEFLQGGSWQCVEIAKGDAPSMVGAIFTFSDDYIVVENFGRRNEIPFNIEFVLNDWPSEGTDAAHLIINGNKEMLATFSSDSNLMMLSWSNDTIKMKLVRNN